MTLRLVVPWLRENWVVGAAFMAAALLVLTPFVLHTQGLLVTLLYLHSPVYMLHQVEEHAGDRFRTFVNSILFEGRLAMTPNDVLIINVGLVWTLNAAALYIAVFFGSAYALIAPYGMLVNAVGHLAWIERFRCYNPGAVTAAIAFLPLSLATLYNVAATGSTSVAQHVVGLAGALVLHGLIAANAIRRVKVR